MSISPESARDRRILLATRMVRLIAYGAISVVLALYLTRVGLSGNEIGLLLCLTLVGDTVISLALATFADRVGRRTILVIGAALMVLGAGAFVLTNNVILLLVAATIGVISPSGNEVGPFLSIEQAALAQIVHDTKRTSVFAWYSLAGSLATAVGSLFGGGSLYLFQRLGYTDIFSYQIVLLFYGGCGVLLGAMFAMLSPSVEITNDHSAGPVRQMIGLHESRGVVFRLAGLFAIDAFGGGFIVQSLMALWFVIRYGSSAATIGSIFFVANIFAGLSHLAAAGLARRIGLINTMFFTHLPSNILLMLVPLMPTFESAVLCLLLRFAISQMDVPTRQSYTMAVVRPSERSAAAGITGVARTIGASISPLFAAPMLASITFLNAPFYLAGGAKIVYDLLLYRSFLKIKPPEEQTSPSKRTQKTKTRRSSRRSTRRR